MMGCRPLRIFVVEDEALLLMQLEMLLHVAGHRVIATAMSGAEALGLIPTLDADLALVDLRLGDGETGLAVGRSLVRAARIPVIFVTANERRVRVGDESAPSRAASGHDDRCAEDAGVLGVIAKPYTVHGLQAALAFLEEALLDPPPRLSPPPSLLITPACAARWQAKAGLAAPTREGSPRSPLAGRQRRCHGAARS
ncbi:response regulator [Methylobacterium durans]|uniref:response regulator n=1 Tax=Methylobacterium durans TaxID=2202825 RepID=UPI002AFDCD08|nr:response regulator [Methylobacterium durans]MEA1831397.1 response regulator [Methylobacterium durans]